MSGPYNNMLPRMSLAGFSSLPLRVRADGCEAGKQIEVHDAGRRVLALRHAS